MVEEREGGFVVNVRDARWYANPRFGRVCGFEDPAARFPQTGVRLAVLEPGKPNCRYHRENAQEDFLVLSGRCKLLINGEEKPLETWDYFHCPPGVSHVFVGDGGRPCVVLMIGHRPAERDYYYPELERARQYGAEAPEPTGDPKVAYSDVPEWEEVSAPAWPPVPD